MFLVQKEQLNNCSFREKRKLFFHVIIFILLLTLPNEIIARYKHKSTHSLNKNTIPLYIHSASIFIGISTFKNRFNQNTYIPYIAD